MHITVIHAPVQAHSSMVLHAWEPGGRTWDVEAVADAAGWYAFVLDGDIADPRTVAFKYRYTDGATSTWEDEAFVRHVPGADPEQTLWTFDLTARVLGQNISGASPAPSDTLTLRVITQRFAGGQVYAWAPGTDNRALFPETGRDSGLSTFAIPLLPWMTTGGFRFKLVGPGNAETAAWEPDRSTRIWFPVDGYTLWLKSGQVNLRAAPLTSQIVDVELLAPTAAGAVPLALTDVIEEYTETVMVSGEEPLDADLRRLHYAVTVYPDALYALGTADGAYSVPLRVWQGDAPERWYGVLGSPGLTTTPAARDALVEVVIHPNPGTLWVGDLELSLYVGPAPRSPGPSAHAAYARVRAVRDAPAGGASPWRATFPALSGGIVQSFGLASVAEGATESRPDGPAQFLRTFTAPATPAGGAPTVYHTADGVPGLSGQGGPDFGDVAPGDRARLMGVTFGDETVGAPVFADFEMPHGVTVAPDGVWFVVRAPHAVTAEVVILTDDGGPGTATLYPMALTADLRYWWRRLPPGAAPHGTPYRFRFNGPDGIEALDPAGRWARDTGSLIVQDDDRAVRQASGPATRVVDAARVAQIFAGDTWQTPAWDDFVLYEMHALRFTARNRDAAGDTLPAFDQVAAELQPGGYLQTLPVTVLEFLPLHEFPQQLGWGYNPSLFFAVDSYYGGPEGLARCVRAAHDAPQWPKGIVLDLVYNHMSDSPLQVIAPDIYVDGETIWGDMVDYDHPACVEFFRQATVFLWRTFRADGFRFDCTEGIVNSRKENPDIIARNPGGSYRFGSGGGWEFLGGLRQALRRAADASGRRWPYLVGENDPNNWGMTDPQSGVLDGQWGFHELYPLGDEARDDLATEKASDIAGAMRHPEEQLRPFHETVRYGESHDSASAQKGKLRVAARPPFGQGLRMAKAVATVPLLGNGVPMLFMGQEAGEHIPFYFDISNLDDPQRYLRLGTYTDLGDSHNRVFAWCRDLLGLRNDPATGLRGDDDQRTQGANRTVAFSRRGGRYFVVVTFGTPYTRQNSAWLGLPGAAAYREIFNSSWPAYAVEDEPNATNGGYNATVRSGDTLNLPFVGAVVLERR